MAAARVLTSDMPPKVSGDQFFATELERLRAALNQHADLLDAAGFDGIAATADHPAFATAREAVAWLLAQPGLREFVAPQAVRAGSLYLTSTGVWAPRYDFTAQATPTAGPNWRLVAGFAGQGSAVTVAGITDATEAGRRMLTAADAAAQRALVNNPNIDAGEYGDHPRFVNTDDAQTGLYAWLIRNVLTLLGAAVIAQPAAPTAGQVDDTADTFSFLPNPAYPSFAQYKVNGLPGVSGAVVLDSTNSYVNGSRIAVKVVGAVPKGGLALYVAGSGNVPDGKALTNDAAFTSSATSTPTSPTPTTDEPMTNQEWFINTTTCTLYEPAKEVEHVFINGLDQIYDGSGSATSVDYTQTLNGAGYVTAVAVSIPASLSKPIIKVVSRPAAGSGGYRTPGVPPSGYGMPATTAGSPGGSGTPPSSATPNVKINKVTVSGTTITIDAVATSNGNGIECSINGIDFGQVGQFVFANQAPGSYAQITVRLADTPSIRDVWGSTVTVSASTPAPGSATLTISNVVVENNQVLVTASTNTGIAIEYSLDGTTYQSASSFSNVPNGLYATISARLQGTSTVYTWPTAVRVSYAPPAQLAAYTGITPQFSSAQDIVFTQDSEQLYVAKKSSNNTTNHFDAYFYADKMLGYSGQTGLQGKFESDGQTVLLQMNAVVIGLNSTKVTDVNALQSSIYFTANDFGALLNGSFAYGPSSYPAGVGGVGVEIWAYDNRVEYYLAYSLNAGDNHLTLLHTQMGAPTYPLIPHVFLSEPTTVAQKLKMTGLNLLTTPV